MITIAEFRKSHHLTYSQVAKMAGVAVHVPFILEIGGRVPFAEERKVLQVYAKLRGQGA